MGVARPTADCGDQTNTGDCRRAVYPERSGTVDGFFPRIYRGFSEGICSPLPTAHRSLFSTCRRSAPYLVAVVNYTRGSPLYYISLLIHAAESFVLPIRVYHII